jgi:hypothetical protein
MLHQRAAKLSDGDDMRLRSRFLFLAVILAAVPLVAQTPPPQPTPQPAQEPPPQPQPAPPAEPSVLSRAASGTYERKESFPNFNLYLPEGQASVRLRKLIKNVLFESQIDYRFVNGNISTFLRYKYYARDYTYKIGVFDTIEFTDIGSKSTKEFQRVRGGLLLFEFPRNYNHRYFWLVQDDRLTFGDITVVDNRKNNIYTKIAYQYGTQFDEHLNSIVGESRGRIVPVLTAFRDLGPQKLSLSAALTTAARIWTGDYKYTKLESEALRRWDLTPTSFVVTRAHLGTFLTKSKIRGLDHPPIERYSIPAYEMFGLGGRDALKSISSKDAATGIHEFNINNEYFVPVFRNRDLQTYKLHWTTLYGIGYLGAGSVGYRLQDAFRVRDYVLDAGLGTEASVTVRNFEVLLSVLYARSIRGPADIRGNKVRFSIRTIR